MKNNLLINTTFLLLSIFFQQVYSQETKWTEFSKDSIRSSLDGGIQCFYYYKSSQKAQPLVVSLHQWGADYKEYSNSLAPQTKSKDWNYIHPDFRGANRHIKACGSEYAIADIDEAIDWAIKHMNVDKDRIYVVGVSGGGHAALCSYMKSRHKIKEYSVWVPISDLEKWYFESKARKSHYAKNIIDCTCEGCTKLNVEKARGRSPLYWETPVDKRKDTKIRIYSGVHDGYTGSVPITHSINFYNKLVSDFGGKDTDKVPDEDIIWLLSTRSSLLNGNKKIGDRNLIYEKLFLHVSLTIFEGGHEVLVNEVLELLSF